MSISAWLSLTLVGYAAVATLGVPLLARKGGWYLRHPERMLRGWLTVLGSSLSALVLGGVVAFGSLWSVRVASVGSVRSWVAEVLLWGGLLALGALLALLTSFAERIAATGRRVQREMRCLPRSTREYAVRPTDCPVTFFESETLIACSIGGRRPEIFVSSGVADRLDPASLDAVIAHELAHIHGRHALITQIAELAVLSAPWLPASRELKRSIAVLVEFVADDRAVITSDRRTLLQALDRLADDTCSHGARIRAHRLTTLPFPAEAA
ncbi:hypothetical protein GCM10027020_13100 [Nocardioides salsibiostraticola]